MMAGLVEHSSATEGESVHVRADKPGFTAGASAPLPAASTAAAGAKCVRHPTCDRRYVFFR